MQATESRPVGSRSRERSAVLAFGPFAFDTRTRMLARDGRELPLPPRVLGVLELLLERAGEVVPRQDLIDTVWKDAFVTDTSLAEAVSVLRQTLGDDPQSPTYIQTRHRRGYRFVAAVVESPKAAPVLETPWPDPRPARVVVSPSIGGQLVPWSAAISVRAARDRRRVAPHASTRPDDRGRSLCRAAGVRHQLRRGCTRRRHLA